MKTKQIVSDYNQIAILLHSVRLEHSGLYLDALEERGIPTFCPRARAFFDNEEVRLLIGCLALLFGYYGEGRGEIGGSALKALADYVDECIVQIGRDFGGSHPLPEALREYVGEIKSLREGESLDRRVTDYFYLLLALPPFSTFVKNENRARNLAILSQLLNTFQNYYSYTVVTFRNRDYLRFHLFNSFLRLLHDGGINEYEDEDRTSLGEVNWIIETKGRVWEGTELKDEAIRLWCARIQDRTKQRWQFARIDQSRFESKKPTTLAEAVSASTTQTALI